MGCFSEDDSVLFFNRPPTHMRPSWSINGSNVTIGLPLRTGRPCVRHLSSSGYTAFWTSRSTNFSAHEYWSTGVTCVHVRQVVHFWCEFPLLWWLNEAAKWVSSAILTTSLFNDEYLVKWSKPTLSSNKFFNGNFVFNKGN